MLSAGVVPLTSSLARRGHSQTIRLRASLDQSVPSIDAASSASADAPSTSISSNTDFSLEPFKQLLDGKKFFCTMCGKCCTGDGEVGTKPWIMHSWLVHPVQQGAMPCLHSSTLAPGGRWGVCCQPGMHVPPLGCSGTPLTDTICQLHAGAHHLSITACKQATPHCFGASASCCHYAKHEPESSLHT